MYGTARLQRRRKLNRSSVAALILLLQFSSGDAWYQPLRIVRVPLSAKRRRQGLLAVSEPPERNVVSNSILDENKLLKQKVKDLEEENEMLHHIAANRIVLENFEGEGKIKQYIMEQKIESTSNEHLDVTVASQWCDELEDGTCPVEPTVSFAEALRDRAVWLVGLLMLQSFSGIILARNEVLLDNHPTIIYFLTMLVGAGGNAGNQASVRVIRGLALGTLNERTQSQFLLRELKMAGALAGILSLAGFVRAALFRTPFPETMAVTASLCMIVFSSVCLGALLPLALKKLRLDPAHSSTTIQVVMDILGVLLAVYTSSLLLDKFGIFSHLLPKR